MTADRVHREVYKRCPRCGETVWPDDENRCPLCGVSLRGERRLELRVRTDDGR